MTELVLDAGRSQVRLRTYAEGFFSRLAHDLELVCGALEGRATQQGPNRGTATLEVPVSGITIAGTIRNGELDVHGMSAADREACLEKMRREVFRSEMDGRVRVEATLDAGAAQMHLHAPFWPSLEWTCHPEMSIAATGGVRVAGSVALSLAKLGVGVVRGPMNAFRLSDRVDVLFDMRFEPAPI